MLIYVLVLCYDKTLYSAWCFSFFCIILLKIKNTKLVTFYFIVIVFLILACFDLPINCCFQAASPLFLHCFFFFFAVCCCSFPQSVLVFIIYNWQWGPNPPYLIKSHLYCLHFLFFKFCSTPFPHSFCSLFLCLNKWSCYI